MKLFKLFPAKLQKAVKKNLHSLLFTSIFFPLNAMFETKFGHNILISTKLVVLPALGGFGFGRVGALQREDEAQHLLPLNRG